MYVIGKKVVFKYTKKDKNLLNEFNKCITAIEKSVWKNGQDVKNTFNDVDHIGENIYIFNIKSSRSLLLIYFDENEIEIVWAGSHNNYEKLFKNNKSAILKYLKAKGY
jgi:mRNA-degrading endonuclease HigB of HigAB toxin-antitoxin module